MTDLCDHGIDPRGCALCLSRELEDANRRRRSDADSFIATLKAIVEHYSENRDDPSEMGLAKAASAEMRRRAVARLRSVASDDQIVDEHSARACAYLLEQSADLDIELIFRPQSSS